jgi:hypothetical protein
MAIQSRSYRWFSGAGIYVADGAAAQNVVTGAGYTKLTCFATNGAAGGDVVADAANDQILIKRGGVYHILFSISFTADTDNTVFRFTAFSDSTELGQMHGGVKIIDKTNLASTSGQGFLAVAAATVAGTPVAITLQARQSEAGTVAITPVYANLTVTYVGEA